MSNAPYRVAVTGGIASGKSNVCLELEKLGGKVINFDVLGKVIGLSLTALLSQVYLFNLFKIKAKLFLLNRNMNLFKLYLI